MATFTLSYRAVTTLTNAIASLGSSTTFIAGYESDVIDNSSDKDVTKIVSGKITVGTTPTANTQIIIYVVVPIDPDTPTWPDVFDGTTGAETLTSAGVGRSFLKQGAVLDVDSNTSDRAYPFSFSIAAACYGVMPKKCVLFTTHNTGVNLNATAGNHVFNVQGVTYAVA